MNWFMEIIYGLLGKSNINCIYNKTECWFDTIQSLTDVQLEKFPDLSSVSEVVNDYTLAEISENSIEKFIKPYRYGTVNNARSTSIQDNHVDCLLLSAK